ncbi:hypothetical protein L1987_32298 [Smallanthus sonchifolius]|uniref:Uncharacterized protein n=1 Tax=Smallanthus sonchifolius TaxID=185202 RepID=A0ACB9I7S6_9ASTR|nr:hypothetical protein L1987_32298 [Smallanthus sonchifolius]
MVVDLCSHSSSFTVPDLDDDGINGCQKSNVKKGGGGGSAAAVEENYLKEAELSIPDDSKHGIEEIHRPKKSHIT